MPQAISKFDSRRTFHGLSKIKFNLAYLKLNAKPFFDCIEKMRTCRSPIFEADLKLQLYGVNEACYPTSSTVIETSKTTMDSRQQIPSSVKNTSHQQTAPLDDGGEFNWKWLQDVPGCKCKLRDYFMDQVKHFLNVQI